MKTIIAGIDPGTKTGVAVWNKKHKQFNLIDTMDILSAIDQIGQQHRLAEKHYGEGSFLVRIENPNLRKWFGNSGREKLQGAGSIKRDFAIWKEYLEKNNIPYEAVAPRNISTKMDAKAFKKLTGVKGRTSGHARDAAMMVFEY